MNSGGGRNPVQSRRTKVELTHTYTYGGNTITDIWIPAQVVASAATWCAVAGIYGWQASTVTAYVFLVNLGLWAGTALLVYLNNLARNAYEEAESRKVEAGNYRDGVKALHRELKSGSELGAGVDRNWDGICTPYVISGILAGVYYITQVVVGGQLSLEALAAAGAIAGATIGIAIGLTAPVGLTQTCLPHVFDILATAAVGAGVLVGLHFTTPLLCSVLGVTSMAAPLTWLAQMGMAFPMVFAGKAGVQWLYNLGISEQLWGPNAVEIV